MNLKESNREFLLNDLRRQLIVLDDLIDLREQIEVVARVQEKSHPAKHLAVSSILDNLTSIMRDGAEAEFVEWNS